MSLLRHAINAALTSDWQKAIAANKSLLAENKEDINSMSRLAHAYVQTGKIKEAQKIYKKILALDKYNTIAAKNLEKLNAMPKSAKTAFRPKSPTVVSPSLFIEEPGKTKTVALINTAPASILLRLNPGEAVFLHPKKHAIEVRTVTKVYIGALPDDFAFKLLRFLKAGYGYEVFIKNTTKNSITVFIRETKRAKRFQSQPTFLSVSPSGRTILLHDGRLTDEEDEKESTDQEAEEE